MSSIVKSLTAGWSSSKAARSPSRSSAPSSGEWPPTPKRTRSDDSSAQSAALQRTDSDYSDCSMYRPFVPSSLNLRRVSAAESEGSINDGPVHFPEPPVRPSAAVPMGTFYSVPPTMSSKKSRDENGYGGGLNVGLRVRKKSSKMSLKSLASSAKASLFTSHSHSTLNSSPPPSPAYPSPPTSPQAINISSPYPTQLPITPPSNHLPLPAPPSPARDRKVSTATSIADPGFYAVEQQAGGVRGKAAKLLGESVVPSGKAARLLGMDPAGKQQRSTKSPVLQPDSHTSDRAWDTDAISVQPSTRPPSRQPPSPAPSTIYHDPIAEGHSPEFSWGFPPPQSSRLSQDSSSTARAYDPRSCSPVSSTFHSPPPSIKRRHMSSTIDPFGGLPPPFLTRESRTYSDPASIWTVQSSNGATPGLRTVERRPSTRGSLQNIGESRESSFVDMELSPKRSSTRRPISPPPLALAPAPASLGSGRRGGGKRETWLSAGAGEIDLGRIAFEELQRREDARRPFPAPVSVPAPVPATVTARKVERQKPAAEWW